MKRSAIVLALAAVLGPAGAATTRVDDSGTVASQGIVEMRWRQLVPGRSADNTVQATLRVALRLNLAPWLNQPVRIYIALAPTTGAPVVAEWLTQGRLLPGALRSGARTLIYEGKVPVSLLEESFDMSLTTDGQSLVNIQTLQFHFEVDTP